MWVDVCGGGEGGLAQVEEEAEEGVDLCVVVCNVRWVVSFVYACVCVVVRGGGLRVLLSGGRGGFVCVDVWMVSPA